MHNGEKLHKQILLNETILHRVLMEVTNGEKLRT